ncbi:MAG: branched-chain amino acid ABC transporter substrate-binding protein [Achromobacter sp.]|jgi:branched-chain amino acid transport system substrate-binding protein|nr:branched-chain amino acid ABC transporter substrate-binding protein [Achromobacter sp.]
MKLIGKGLFSAVLGAGLALWQPAQAAEPIRIGVSTYLSGAGAVFGVPAQQAARLQVEKINSAGGIKGAPIELTFIDENHGVDNVVVEYRSLVESGKVDAMIIGLSSSICLAVAPVAEQLKMPTMLWDCGTERIYTDAKYEYVYRTSDYTPSNNVATALYLLKLMPEVKTIAGINQDYAFGRDNWAAFRGAVQALRPDVKVVAEMFPKLGTSDYSTEISRLSALRPDVIFTTLWGGDMNTFVKQASSRALFRNSRLVAANGESSMQQLGKAFPEGAIVGMRGDSWAFNPAMAGNAEHQAFVTDFEKGTGAYPSFPAYHMAQAVRAVQQALETSWDGDRKTLQASLLKGWNGLELDDFTGQLKIREDHQAMEGQLLGVATEKSGQNFKTLKQLLVIPPELTSPPVGVKSDDWFKTLSPEVLRRVGTPTE